jgi:3',5'-cyclic AMP phosphodiesterase CpdA
LRRARAAREAALLGRASHGAHMTTTIRVFQVSDTHLSGERPFFVANWEAFAQAVDEARPDMVINTGDIALDGPGRPDDLAFARTLHDALCVPHLCIPGNHDVGDNPAEGYAPKQVVTAEGLAGFRRIFGADWWTVDAGAWRFIGLNAQLLGSALPDEDAQWAFLAEALDEAEERPIAVWIHKPLLNRDPGETGETAYRYVVPAARDRLLALFATAPVKLVASGHTHQHRRTRTAGIDFVWGPSSGFVLKSAAMQPVIGTKEVGFVDYSFAPDGVATVAIRRVPAMLDHDIADFPNAYREHGWPPKPAAPAVESPA